MKNPLGVRYRLGAMHRRSHNTMPRLGSGADVSPTMMESLEPRLLLSATFTEEIAAGAGDGGFADFNNDGWTDMLSGASVSYNQGASSPGSFSGLKPLPNVSHGPATAGDFDNDGFLDLYSYGDHMLFRNINGTSFEDVSHMLPTIPNPNSRGAAFADVNGDGFVDLYVGGFETWSSAYYPDTLLINDGGIGFRLGWTQSNDAQVSGGRPRPARGITTADFDQDGDIDIYSSNYRLEPNGLWLNDGNGNITDVASSRGATGGFGHTIGSAWGDMDEDGYLDLFVGNFSHPGQPTALFLRNTGPSGGYSFQNMQELDGGDWMESYASPALGDYDNDGDLDLFLTSVYPGDQSRLYRNDGNWNFTFASGESNLPTGNHVYQAYWGDVDNDGDLDLVHGGSLFRNNGNIGVPNHWLKVKLIGNGTTVNSAALGAQVRVSVNGKTLTRQVSGATGEGNSNDLTLHFGLGSYSGQVAIEVIWKAGPGGISTFHTTSVNETVTIEMNDTNEAPTKPRNLRAEEVLQDRATVLWWKSTDADGDAIRYDMQYRKNDNSEPWSAVTTTKNNSISIRELERNTAYKARVRATDGEENSSWLLVKDLFTTPNNPNNAPERPGPITATNVGGRAATLSWEPGTDVDEDTLSYIIEYRASGEMEWTEGHTAEDTTYNLDGLLDITTYDIRIASFDGQLTSRWRGGHNLFTTLDTNVAPLAPTNLSVVEVVNNSATIQWDVAVDENGDGVTYQVRFRGAGESWGQIIDVSETQHTMVNLLDETEYDVRVRALDHRANSPWYQELDLFVSGERNRKPSDPANLRATNIGRTTATLEWEVSTDLNASDTVMYEVQWKQFHAPDWSATISVSAPLLDLGGLKKGDKVDVRVRATDMVLNSRWNKKVQLFRTNGNPTAPLKLKASQVLHDRATVSWDASKDVSDDITHYEVWCRRTGEVWGDAEIKNSDGTTIVLWDLDPLTSYDVRVRAKDTLGQGQFVGRNKLFTTVEVPNQPPPKPENITATEVTDRAALIDWYDAMDSDGDVVTYNVRYRVSGTQVFTTATAGLTESTYLLTGLAPETSYSVRIVAFDAESSSAMNALSLFTTFVAGSNEAPEAVTDLAATNVENTEAKVTWTASLDADRDAVTYTVAYRSAGSTDWTTSGSTSDTTHTLMGLAAGTEYDLKVTSSDGIAATNAEHLGLFTTTSGTPAPPSRPSGITASEVAANSVVITWDSSVDRNGQTVTYIIRYRINSTSRWGTLYETTETSYTLTGLQAGTDYDIRLMASDGKLKSARNVTNLFTTVVVAPAPPSKPSGITASNITANSADIAWNTSTNPTGEWFCYRVRYRLAGTTTWSTPISTAATALTLTGLVSGEIYDVKVIATDRILSSARAKYSLFTTASPAVSFVGWR